MSQPNGDVSNPYLLSYSHFSMFCVLCHFFTWLVYVVALGVINICNTSCLTVFPSTSYWKIGNTKARIKGTFVILVFYQVISTYDRKNIVNNFSSLIWPHCTNINMQKLHYALGFNTEPTNHRGCAL